MKKGISRFSMAFAGAALAAQVATVSVAAEPHWDRNGRIERNGQRRSSNRRIVMNVMVGQEGQTGFDPTRPGGWCGPEWQCGHAGNLPTRDDRVFGGPRL